MLKVTNDLMHEGQNLVSRTMENANTKAVLTAISGTITYVIGGWTEIMTALLMLMCFDIITGHIKSSKTNKVSSKIGFNGLVRKGLIFMVIIMGHLIDKISPIGIEGITVKDVVVLWYVWNEFISVMHNLEEMGVKVPKFLTSIISSKRERLNDTINNVICESPIEEDIIESKEQSESPVQEENIYVEEESIPIVNELPSVKKTENKYEINIQFRKK